MGKKRGKRRHRRKAATPTNTQGVLRRLKSPAHIIGLMAIVAAVAVGILQVMSDREIAELSGELSSPRAEFDVGSVKPSPSRPLLITTFVPDSLSALDVSTQIPIGLVNRGSRTLRGITVSVALPAGFEEDSAHYPGLYLYDAPPGAKALLKRSRYGRHVVDAYRIPDLNPGIGIDMFYPVRVNAAHSSAEAAALSRRQPKFVGISLILDALDFHSTTVPLLLMIVPAADTNAYLATVEDYFDMRQRRMKSSKSTFRYLASALRPQVDTVVVLLPTYKIAAAQGRRFALNMVRDFPVRIYKIPEARWDLVFR